MPSDGHSSSGRSKRSAARRSSKNSEKEPDLRERDRSIYKSVRAPSDLDSQISLPRSNTLPREFKYHRRPKARKTIRNDQFLASNNSNEGYLKSEYGNQSFGTERSILEDYYNGVSPFYASLKVGFFYKIN